MPIERLEAVEAGLGNVDTDLLKTFSAHHDAAQYVQAFRSGSAAPERDLNAYRGTSLDGAELAAAQQFQSD